MTGTRSVLIDLTGGQYGQWTVISRAKDLKNNVMWKCRCACGTERSVNGGALKRGKSISCGCARRKNRGGKGKGRHSDGYILVYDTSTGY